MTLTPGIYYLVAWAKVMIMTTLFRYTPFDVY